ncbi:MAG: sigma-70 family RNA polymerase sigma factor [Clostridia bacterium]|nr:sigma-70 family RNA polymerase sigma factor [Clostridia bacterium]
MERKEKRAARMPLDDETIIDLYWARDEKAIEETDRKYKPYLYAVVYRVLHDEQDTAECINDTYLGAWNAIPPARPRAFKAFLTTIAHRIAIKRYHHTRRGRMVPSEMTVSLSELEDFIAEEGDPTQDFDSARLGRVISLFVRSLSERRRFIFMSRYYMSEPIDEIARDLSVSRSTVNKELAAIRAALKEKLEDEGYLI